MQITEKTLSVESIFKGRVVDLRVEKVQLPDGSESVRELVDHRGAVAIVAITSPGKVLLVKQYRKALDRETLELPAGLLEPGEKPETCAVRELEEETGYKAGEVIPLTKYYTSPGFTNEIVHIYLAKNLTLTKQNLDEDEFVQVEELELPHLLEMLNSGKIMDGKTITGILATQNYLKEGKVFW
ncbi:ADP-ribose pyrophosphatase [Desulfitispora alkaliphila]